MALNGSSQTPVTGSLESVAFIDDETFISGSDAG